MKKTILILTVTALICGVLCTGSAFAAAKGKSPYYTHYGVYAMDMATWGKEVPTTLGVIRNFYDSFDFTGKCSYGISMFNDTEITMKNGENMHEICKGCRRIFNKELYPVPAEEE